MSKLIKIDALARDKVKICVDKNIKQLSILLREKGYNTFVYELDDNELHRRLNRDAIRIFITNNYKDFRYKEGTKYALIGISGSVKDSNPMDAIARAIECFFMKYPVAFDKIGTGISVELTSGYLRALGCRMLKMTD